MIYYLCEKGFDGEGVLFEPWREVTVGASRRGENMFVASEPEGRKRFASRTFP